jgi:hypothetical protein
MKLILQNANFEFVDSETLIKYKLVIVPYIGINDKKGNHYDVSLLKNDVPVKILTNVQNPYDDKFITVDSAIAFISQEFIRMLL